VHDVAGRHVQVGAVGPAHGVAVGNRVIAIGPVIGAVPAQGRVVHLIDVGAGRVHADFGLAVEELERRAAIGR
jgi:hypothetical protein